MRSFLPPLPPPVPQRPKRRRPLLRLPEDADRRALLIGLCATILVHVLVIVFMPSRLDSDFSGEYTPEHMGTQSKNFNIELAPEEFAPLVPPKPKPPVKFVETNPDLPDNEPDKTQNFAAQNQQAAQEKPAKNTEGDRPEMEGKKDLEPSQVVSGNLSPTTPVVPIPPPPTPMVPNDQPETPTPVRERTPLPGVERYVGENDHTFGSNIAKVAPHPEDLDRKVEGMPDAQTLEGVSGVRAKVSQVQLPRERPKLDKRARPAIFAENKLGTANIGPAAVDARWSNYGQYLQKLIEAVQMQFDRLNDESRSRPAPGSVVTVKFILDSNGEISRVVSVESGMSGQQAERIAVSSITNPAPYGKWTDDMVAMLGPEQEMTFAFYYQ